LVILNFALGIPMGEFRISVSGSSAGFGDSGSSLSRLPSYRVDTSLELKKEILPHPVTKTLTEFVRMTLFYIVRGGQAAES